MKQGMCMVKFDGKMYFADDWGNKFWKGKAEEEET